jgi:hypothetical protein
MPEALLFPRLASAPARRILHGVGARAGAARLRELAEPHVVWAGSGGTRAPAAVLDRISAQVRDLAAGCGFPKEGSVGGRAAFDARCAAWFTATGAVPVAEALRDDVWTWIAVALLPDVCVWRFEAAPTERFLGGRRNALQRLWMRGRAFDRGAGAPERWKLLEILSEDALVQITERPSIGADPRLARAIGEAWSFASPNATGLAREETIREAVRRIRVAGEVMCFAALSDSELEQVMRSHFAAALRKDRFPSF